MSLIICSECSKEYSTTAAACPNCGARIRRPKLWLWIPLGLIGAFVAFALIRTPSPEEDAKYRDRQAIELCHDYKEQSNVPATAALMTGTCAKMESDFTQKYGVSP